MRHTLHLLLLAILLLGLKSARAQIFTEQERLRIAYGFGLANHFNEPVRFPTGFFDFDEIPDEQSPELGRQFNASYLLRISDRLSLGPSFVSSHYGFYEEGVFTTIAGYDPENTYSTSRTFKMVGIGLDVLYKLFSNSVNGVDLIGGFTREWFRETPGVRLYNDMYQKSNYLGHLKIEYKHHILEDLHLNIGVYVSMSLGSFYKHIDYRPYRAGIAVGVEYVFLRNERE
jgi:hypothetical protein